MSAKKKARNKLIKKRIRALSSMGYKIKNTFPVVGDKFFLSSERVRKIWYE